MNRKLPTLAILTVVWVALWGRLTLANLLGGAIVGALLLALPTSDRHGHRALRPLPALRFAAYFLRKLVEASFTVAWEVLTPRNRITEGIVSVPIIGASDGLVVIVANAISLTPGTLTIEVDERVPVLYVHVLHLRDVDAVRREIQHLEALAVRAFGSSAAVAALPGVPPPPHTLARQHATTAASTHQGGPRP